MRAYVVVELHIVGDPGKWELTCTSDNTPYGSCRAARYGGESRLEHDDFWIAEIVDDRLSGILHSNCERRQQVTSDEIAAVAGALGLLPTGR